MKTTSLLSLLLFFTTLISASPTPTLNSRTYRIPSYSKVSQARNRSNSLTDGVIVEFTSSRTGLFVVTQPNVAANCTTWRSIGANENWNQVGIVMQLAGVSLRSFLELNPDVPVSQVMNEVGGLGTGITPGILYCFSTQKWAVEDATYLAYTVSWFEWGQAGSSLM